MEEKLRKTGINIIGDVSWGTHFCQFYQTKVDLIDILVPYFKAGLENNEFCMWVTSEPLNSEDASRALKKQVKNLDDYIKKGQIEILDYTQWYIKAERFYPNDVLQGWIEKEKRALKKRFEGLRLTGNTFWLQKRYWKDFTEYEAVVNSIIAKYRMLAVCTYCLDKCTASEIIDVVSNHQFALIKREGKWKIIESAEYKKTAEAWRQSEQKFRLAFENAIDAIFWADPQTGLITNCNKAAEALLEKTKGDIIGQPQITLHPPEKARYYENLFKKHAKQGKAFNDDAEIITKSGKIRPVNVTASVTLVGEQPVIQGIFHDITERKRGEEVLKQAQKELTIRNKIAEIFLTVPDEQMFGEALQVILEAMESEFGIFGYIDEHDVLIIPSMTRDIWEKCQIPDKTIVYPPEKWGGIWGRALIEKRSLSANQGLHVPEGHVPITRVLVIPIIYSKQVIGLLEVANKAIDYSYKDQEFLETIAGKIAPILNARMQRDREERERKQTEEALRKARNELEQRVKERTVDLEKVNEQLIQKIEELQRTKETLTESESTLRKSQDNLRSMAGKLLSIQEEERRLLAREMHDDLTQRLAILAIDTGKLQQQLESQPKPFQDEIRQIKEQIVKLSADIHDISRQLHPAIIDDLGLVDAIKSECSSFSNREGILISYESKNIPDDIPNNIALCVYRITQEALRNIAKHAHVKEAEVSLARVDNGINLYVRDSGVGFDPATIHGHRGLGISSMEERVRLIQGELSIQSQPGQGTVIKLWAPLSRRSE